MVPQDIALYEDLSGRENLLFWGRMYGMSGAALNKRVDEVLELIGLVDRQKDRVDKYSGGMKRRVNIGAALLHKPRFLYLDEPTVGIDPQSRRSILDGVKDLNAVGRDRALHHPLHGRGAGALRPHRDHGPRSDDRRGHAGRAGAPGGGADPHRPGRSTARLRLLAERWRELPGVSSVSEPEDGRVWLLVDDANTLMPQLFDGARAAGARITEISLAEPNLEMVFLHLTGRALRD